LSHVPYLLKGAPTHTQTGKARPSDNSLTQVISESNADKAAPVTTQGANDPYGPRRWYSNLVRLSGNNRALNEFSVERVGEAVDENLVMLHGYGAGLGFFYRNFEGLSRVKGWKVWAVDLLGMGRSSRPPFKIHAKDQAGKIAEAESWFVDALEEWRVQKQIDRFTLLGHSLGGYMAVAYALKYPGHLNKLILASPVGIPEDPYAMNAAMPEPPASTLSNEFTQSEDDIVSKSNPKVPAGGAAASDNNNFLNARSKADAPSSAKASSIHGDNKTTPSAPRRPLPPWLVYLWDANISPFSIVRWAGPLGPNFVSGWTSRRFAHLPPEQSQALHTYAYSLFRQRGSGEYALAYILAPGAFARSPLIRRIQGVGRQVLSAPASSASVSASSSSSPIHGLRERGIPVVMMYGENDWMDIAGGYAAEAKINADRERILNDPDTTEEERRLDRGAARVVIIKKAGHHLYLEGWEEFNEVMREEMRDTSRSDGHES
jgi:cardiolipin-specific phospholipase